MDIQLISLGLALIVGGLAFLLVKRTTDEFDRWYTDDDYRRTALHIPPVIASLILAGGVMIVTALVR